MAKLNLKSQNQILGDMITTMLARTGVNDFNPGSVALALLTTSAREDYQQYYQMLQIIRNYNLDTTTGDDLDNRAFEYGITREDAKRTTGKITILREEGFVKISTNHFTGIRSRLSGDSELFLNDASLFPSSGSNTLILGRGTPNEEEVTYTGSGSNPENNVNYYKITLDAPMTNDHGQDEDVVLKQGSDVTIGAGTVVRVPETANTAEVQFSLTTDVVLLAGEDQVEDVGVKASQTGAVGNISVNAINGTGAFSAPPFADARAQNDAAYSNGRDRETDTELRSRIRAHIQGLAQSTQAGITNGISGLVDPDTAKRVVSSNIILPDNVGLPVKIYIDDGTGFEPTFENKGQETILVSAEGGETRVQLELFPLVKAQLETLSAEPYDFSTNGLTLQLNVGPDSETITFFTNDFNIPEAATAEEVVAAINNASSYIEARTSQVGTKVVINAKADTNEEIQVTGGTANSGILDFSTDLRKTFYLYKNDNLLSKDGETAFVESVNAAPYDFSGVDRDLVLIVDGKTANPQTATISESDFDSPAAAAQATAQQIADLINTQIAGAVASDVNGIVRITSNTLLSASSKIKINTSAANTLLGFPTTEVVGKNLDYTLNPELGVIELAQPLVEFDSLTAGTRLTRAFLTASIPGDYTFVGGETLDINVEGVGPQTITFTAGSFSVSSVVSAINSQVTGITATTRTIGADNYLELRTNLYNSSGSLEIVSTSTANGIFGFTLDTVVTNREPHVAAVVASNSGPYTFVEGNTLVVVLDNDAAGKTFVVTMDYDSEITSGVSTTFFAASGLISVFPSNDEINDYWVVFKSGDNTITGTVTDVTNPSGTTFRYYYDTPPTNFGDFAAGDQVSFSGMQQTINDGNFIVQNLVTINSVLADVLDKDLDTPPGGPSLGDRYIVALTANDTLSASVLDKDLDTPPGGPSLGDRYIVQADANNVKLTAVKDLFPSSSLATTTHNFRYLIDRGAVVDQGIVNSIENDDTGLNDAIGQRYLVGAFPVNGFTGQANKIAEGTGAGFSFVSPLTDGEVFVTASAEYYFWDNTNWLVNEWALHPNQIAQYNGVGTPGWVYITPNDNDVVDDLDTGDTYQFDSGGGTWSVNAWGGQAGKVAEWDGADWVFTIPAEDEVRLVTDEAERYQYDSGTNTWAVNAWGSQAADIAEWNGASWDFTTPSTNDTVTITDESEDYIFNGTTWEVFSFWIEVTNSSGLAETGSSGTGLVGQRRQVLDYAGASGAITLASALRTIPTPTDEVLILPSTGQNVIDFFNNTKVTSLSGRSYIEAVNAGTQIQISSKLNGSDGFVRVTGGKANAELGFSTSLVQGLQAYSYYVGLIKLVHRTVYGDEQDLVAYPGYGGAGIKFQILPPTVQQVPFTVELTLTEGTSLSSVETNVKSVISSYVNALGISSTVVLSNVVDTILTVEGVTDVLITSPTTNVTIADNELARTKASLISVEQA